MNKIFISYSQKDYELYNTLKGLLINMGHEVLGADSLSIGSPLTSEIKHLIDSADAVIALVTENSVNSEHVHNEIVIARAQMGPLGTLGEHPFFPIMIGNVDIPDSLKGVMVKMMYEPSEEGFAESVHEVHETIERNNAIREKFEKEKEKQIEKLEASKTEFINEAEERLNKKEQSLRRNANIWYLVGYLALILGVTAAVFLINESITASIDTGIIVLLSIKGIIGIGLLVASSKYAFTLGKSYMNESLKNSDRLHAISFGKFYLQVYGDVVSPDDVKSVFQHWNIDRDSSFRDIQADNFDPKILETAIEIARAITKNDKKDSKGT